MGSTRTPVLLVALLTAIGVARTMEATTVLPLNFDQIQRIASRIFIGTCTAIADGATPEGLPFTAYEFTVEESLRGSLGPTVVIRQFGARRTGAFDGARLQVFRVPGMPDYKRGERLLLFLNPESSIGLTTPVGLFQGVFGLARDGGGEMVAVNGMANVNLFRGMGNLPDTAAAHRRGPVRLALLRELLAR